MRIIVLAKEVPDTYGDRKLVLETGLVDRAAGDLVVDEVSERAVEAALTIAGQHPGSTVSVITMGPASAAEPAKKTLAMGADDLLHVLDDGLVGADATLTAEVLAAALRGREPDLVLLGNLSTDGGGGVVAAMMAELLGLPQLTNLSSLEVDSSGTVRGTRATDNGNYAIEAALPAVASINEALPDPRFPSFKGIMAAKKKPRETVTAAELGVEVADETVARSIIISAAERPARQAGTKIVDEGDGGRLLAEFLMANKLV